MAVEMIKMEVELPKELNEVFVALAKIVKVGKESQKDGFQIADVAVVFGGVIAELTAALEGAEKIPAAIVEEKTKSLVCAAIGGAAILGEFL